MTNEIELEELTNYDESVYMVKNHTAMTTINTFIHFFLSIKRSRTWVTVKYPAPIANTVPTM